MRRRRCHFGRDVRVIDETSRDVYLESELRLQPGTEIELWDGSGRVALVETWGVARLGRPGPVFRGVCRWVGTNGSPGAGRTRAPAVDSTVSGGTGDGTTFE